jgi:thiosulfate/3-mercaptopyruvate sulfurtransferase
MNLRTSIVVSLILLCSCNQGIERESDFTSWNYLIEADELTDLLHQPHIKVLDFQAEDNYVKAHIPRAVHVSRRDIENDSFPYSGIMAGKAQIEDLLGSLGIQHSDTLVIYDDNGMCEAARMWWVLQNYNFKNVRILNGGIDAWKAINGALSVEVPKVNTVEFKLPDESSMLYHIDKTDLLNAITSNSLIIDTRSVEEYRGDYTKNGASRAGRIPNSLNIDWAHSINFNGDKRFKSIEDLQMIYKVLATDKKNLIIPYCHSGVRSAHTTFVLTQLLGYENVRNYDGSWVEWSYLQELPIEQTN